MFRPIRVGIILPHTQEEFGVTTKEEHQNHPGHEHKYARALSEQGFIVTVYVFHYGKETWELTHMFGHRIVVVPVEFSAGPGRQISLSLLRKLATDWRNKTFDVLYIFSYYCLMYDLFALFCFLFRIPFIAQYHSGTINWKNPIHLLRVLFLFGSLRLACRVLSVQQFETRNLRNIWKISNAEYLANWVDRTVFVDKNLPRTRDLLFSGRLVEGKGIRTLLEALRLVLMKRPQTTLTIIGRGPLESWARHYVQIHHLEKNVTFLGYVDQSTLVEAYNTHRLGVFPTKAKVPVGVSVVILEALACGLPSIVSTAVGDELGPSYTLKAIQDDPSSLAETILYALSNESIVKENLKYGHQLLDKYFDKTRNTTRLAEILYECVRDVNETQQE